MGKGFRFRAETERLSGRPARPRTERVAAADYPGVTASRSGIRSIRKRKARRVNDIKPAGVIVRDLVSEAEAALTDSKPA